MGAKISSTPFIRRGGTTVENDPIIKSDGVGEVMQWLASTGGKNITIDESATNEMSLTVGSLEIGHGLGSGGTADTNSTAVGREALDGTTSGATNNTAIGSAALSAATSGDENTAVGRKALEVFTGSNATAIGANAADSATSATYLTAVGYNALGACTEGVGNTAIGAEAGAGITDSSYCMFAGYSTGQQTTGMRNTMLGSLAGQFATTTDDCIAIGVSALRANDAAGDNSDNATGNNNIAIGNFSLDATTTGNGNLVIGHYAGTTITTGAQNVLIGHESGYALSTNSNCTGVGYKSLNTTTGAGNTALGANTMMYLVAGVDNVAVGKDALYSVGDPDGTDSDGSESYNTAVGSAALYSLENSASDGNVALGYEAGRYYNDGGSNTALKNADNCVLIGHLARTSRDDADNQIVIGYNALGIGNNTVALGDTNITAIKGQVDFAAYSDRRIKRDIANDDTGLAFIEKLQPVTFKFKNPADYPDSDDEGRLLDGSYKERTEEQLVTPAVKAQDEVWEDEVVQEAREEVKGERHKYDEREVTEEVEKVEMVKGEGNNYIRKVSTETVTRIERIPLYDDHPVVNEDGSPCVDSNGDPVIHKCPVMEEYIVQEASDEVTKRRLVSAAVEAQDAVYETVTVPAIDRPADNDTVRLGLIAQDVQTALDEVGLDVDIVDESPDGRLSLKYGSLVMPLIKAVQELSARVKVLEG